MSAPENDLTTTLNRQAEQYARRGGSDIALDQVMARAGEIQRGRRMRATMVMAAVVLAIAVPVGITVLADNEATKPKPPPVATTTKPDTSLIGLGDLKSGPAPKDGYLLAGTLHGPAGTQMIGKGGEPIEIAHIVGGFLVARASLTGGDSKVEFIADERGGGTANTWAYGDSGFATSPDGRIAAFVEPDGTVIAVQDGGTIQPVVGKLPTRTDGSVYQVDAVVGENCSGRSEVSTCTVFAHSSGDPVEAYSVSPNGQPVPFDGFRSLAGVTDDGLVAGIISVDRSNNTCSAVNDSGKQLWKTCDKRLVALSPNGQFAVAAGPVGDGAGDSGLTIFDTRTGEVVLDLGSSAATSITDYRWEDDGHVIVSVLGITESAIERIALNGVREYASTVEQDAETFVSPFKLG